MTQQKSRFVLAALVALALFTATGALAQNPFFSQEVDASSGETLRVDLEAGGKVEIVGWGRNAVSVEASGSSDRVEVSLRRSGDSVVLRADYKERRRRNSARLSMKISVPNTFDLDLDSTGGSVSIEGLEGRFEGRTMGGELSLRDLRGYADLETMGGDITVNDSELDGKVSTMGGRVTMRDILGDLKGSSMGGNVSLERVTRRSGDSTGEAVIISTMGGDVDVNEAPAGAKLRTMGGDIVVGSASDYVDAETMGGDIVLRDIEGWVKAVTMGGDLEVEVLGDGPDGGDIELRSMGGKVRLVVPPGYGMDFDIELAYTKRHVGKHDIKTSLPIERSETTEWEYDHGSARRYILGSGSVNGGGHRVRIRTINGDIVIEEQ